MTTHTPTPWAWIDDGLFGGVYLDDKKRLHHPYQVFPFYDADRTQGMHGKRHEADKSFVLHAVNNHDALLAALQSVVDRLSVNGVGNRFELDYDTVEIVRSAIAAATGESANVPA